MNIKPMHLYRNKKNKHIYRCLGITTHTETMESLVLYQATTGNTETLWVRPLELFLEKFEVIA